MEVIVIKKYQENNSWNVTYKYWIKGQCACTATKIKRVFENDPTEKELIAAI